MRPGWLIRPEGAVPYGPANEAMHRWAERRLADEIPDTVILLQHSPVFTAGRRAKPEELLWSAEEVAVRDAEVHRIDRGGSFTFHGPGQLVGYPIIDLGPAPDAAAHLRRMEEVVIRAAADVGVELHRRPEVQTGVWAGDRKVCAIGVRLMRARVTVHGFAVNCDEHGVTSLSELAGRPITVDTLGPFVERHLAAIFGLDLVAAPREEAARVQPVLVR